MLRGTYLFFWGTSVVVCERWQAVGEWWVMGLARGLCCIDQER
ncbi:hypothetical protein SynPROS71_00179 [Synechococcus sp. PROS-7-1]|nr:hypothetical protein SynPROS71_00179 [Synechococcus sp. PROS-7-1]